MSILKKISIVFLYLLFIMAGLFYLYVCVLPWFTVENIELSDYEGEMVVIILFQLAMTLSIVSMTPVPINKFYRFRLISFGLGIVLILIYNPLIPNHMNIRADLVFLAFFYVLGLISLGISWKIWNKEENK